MNEKNKSSTALRTIGEASEAVGVPQHVLRFWETKFTEVKPMKRGGGRRYYRPEDIQILKKIKTLLHDEGYTIKGATTFLKQGNTNKTQKPTHSKESKQAQKAQSSKRLNLLIDLRHNLQKVRETLG